MDDRWHPERLEHLVARMDAQPTMLLLHGNAGRIDADGNPLGNTLFDALGVSHSELRAIFQGRALDVLLDRNLVTVQPPFSAVACLMPPCRSRRIGFTTSGWAS
jgi:hypothetical protein